VRLKRRSTTWSLLTLAVLSGVLSLAVGYLAPSSLSRGSIAAAEVPLELTPQAFLPLVVRSPVPEPPLLTIYDLYGTVQDWDWLTDRFGAVTLERGTGTASVTVLRAKEGPVALVIRVIDSGGNPVENVPVVFYWESAPELEPWQQACGLDQGEVHYTKSDGYTDFIMGGGAQYKPPAGGPHTVWLAVEGTDCLGGLGWLFGTNHIHLNSEWILP
jgi:hypothetical protein